MGGLGFDWMDGLEGSGLAWSSRVLCTMATALANVKADQYEPIASPRQCLAVANLRCSRRLLRGQKEFGTVGTEDRIPRHRAAALGCGGAQDAAVAGVLSIQSWIPGVAGISVNHV